jgi:hypothetical protein
VNSIEPAEIRKLVEPYLKEHRWENVGQQSLCLHNWGWHSRNNSLVPADGSTNRQGC